MAPPPGGVDSHDDHSSDPPVRSSRDRSSSCDARCRRRQSTLNKGPRTRSSRALTASLSTADNPREPLIEGRDGNLYGTTVGGRPFRTGTVFKIDAAGVLTTLHHFSGRDGVSARRGVIQATDGSFYGTTEFGGAFNRGHSLQDRCGWTRDDTPHFSEETALSRGFSFKGVEERSLVSRDFDGVPTQSWGRSHNAPSFRRSALRTFSQPR